jgi:hypothetical protein
LIYLIYIIAQIHSLLNESKKSSVSYKKERMEYFMRLTINVILEIIFILK